MQNKKVTSNIEDYLKTIYRIELERGVVRVKEISVAMNVTYPSTSGILKKIEAMGLVEHERYGYVRLSAAGREIASKILDRETKIALFLHNVLQLDEGDATVEACKMEHAMTDETALKLLNFIDYINTPSEVRDRFLNAFHKKTEQEVEVEALPH